MANLTNQQKIRKINQVMADYRKKNESFENEKKPNGPKNTCSPWLTTKLTKLLIS
jgi:hypothetical protein